MSWRRLVCVHAPFGKPGTHIFQEKWKVVFGASCAVWTRTSIALSSTGRIQIGLHINWAAGCGRIIPSEVEERNRLRSKQTHHLFRQNREQFALTST